MKNFLMICGLLLSLISTGISQTNIPVQNAVIACPDPAVMDLNIQYLNPSPPQNYHVYNMIGIISNVGTANFNPAPSGFTAFWYADSGAGYKLVKKEALPGPMAPGDTQSIVFKGRFLPGTSAPDFILRIAPTINIPAIQSDCDLSNNQKSFKP